MQRLQQPIVFYIFAVPTIILLIGASQSHSLQTELLVSQIELAEVAPPYPSDGLLADPATKEFYIPPRVLPGRAVETATFTINWNPTRCSGTTTEWSAEAQAAFAYAVDIWESLIVSSVPIEVDACWKVLGTNVLGSAGTTNVGRNFAGAPQPNTWYPIALLNSITGSDANGATPEISANFNSEFDNWYFGTDGTPNYNQYDFVSVVLHEIGHGLGFAGSMYVYSETGSYGYGRSGAYDPLIYDRFVENGNEVVLIDGFANNSPNLAQQLTSNDLYFDGEHVRSANDGAPAKIYAPGRWSQGSSFSHLDVAFDNSDHALMTHSIANGEALHDPGNIALALLKDSGWTVSMPKPIPENTPTPLPTSSPVPSPTITPTPSPYPEPESDEQGMYIDSIDNEHVNTSSGYSLSEENVRWQKFIPRMSNLVAAEIFLTLTGNATDVVVRISDKDDIEMAVGLIPADQAKAGWNKVTFNEPIDLTPGVAYKISVIYSANGRKNVGTLEWKGGRADEYCVACESDVSALNYEYSYALRTVSRIYLDQTRYMPIVRR